MQKHQYAEILIAISNNEEIQYKDGDEWEDIAEYSALVGIAKQHWIPKRMRVKPKLIEVGNVSVPSPEKNQLDIDTPYYMVDLCGQHTVLLSVWKGSESDKLGLMRGLIHLTEDAAQKHAAALIKISGGSV